MVDRGGSGIPAVPSRASLTDAVHESLLGWLMDGNVRPGQSLSIDGLARDLGVSPTPVREALARLEPSGLVERVALRGYRAARMLTVEEMHALMDARVLIECRSSAVLAGSVTPATVERLQDTVRRQRGAGRGPDFAQYRDYHVADSEFHRVLNEAAGNPFLAAAFEGLNGQLQRFRLRLHPHHGVTDAEAAVAEHVAILDAVEAGDPGAAEAAMRAHLEAVRERAAAEVAEVGGAAQPAAGVPPSSAGRNRAR
ncbi:GntR family transcriptional regulator [Kineococcus gynurae]|uniref:GntR family transcriptional regulator n=1 Tax=Kineococcus gynurae TaxID=452979 RepID=A0ABV5LXE6_9ACTN